MSGHKQERKPIDSVEEGRSRSGRRGHSSQKGRLEDESVPEKFEQEVETGNVEYKWKLVKTSQDRLQHLTTQLNFRLNEGDHGEAIYLIGVQDDGKPVGISDNELKESLRTLRVMAAGVNAEIKGVRVQKGEKGKLAKVVVRRRESRLPALELRIAVIGEVDSGKSTLVGVVTKCILDNGRGLARMQVFRHNHEVENGRTSSITQHILGFRDDGRVANDACHPLSIEEIQHQSVKIITFIDLAGHVKYVKTTLSGMVGLPPDYVMLTVAGTHGIQDTTREHLGVALALKVPLLTVLTKIDLATEEVLASTIDTLARLLECSGKKAKLINGKEDLLSAIEGLAKCEVVPIFQASNVTGQGLDLVQECLKLLPRSKAWDQAKHEAVFVGVEDSFHVEGVGRVLSGTVYRGCVEVGDQMLLGPDRVDGSFQPVTVKSIHINRIPVKSAVAGQGMTFALKMHEHLSPRKHFKGTVLVAASSRPSASYGFSAEVVILYGRSSIGVNHEPVIHCNTIRQTAKILSIEEGQTSEVKTSVYMFRFMFHPEFISEGTTILIRDGRTLGLGKVLTVH